MSERVTECILEINLIDVSAKLDSTPTIVNTDVALSDITRLQREFNDSVRYMSCALNETILDGSRDTLSESDISLNYSIVGNLYGLERTTYNNPQLTLNFSENHASAGITFYFQDNLPKSILVEWYNADSELIGDGYFYPDSEMFFCDKNVKNYRKIIVTFSECIYPYSRLKMNNIEYGTKITKGKESVFAATITEEVDIISKELSINTMVASLFSDDKDFNQINPLGKYALLQKKQEISVIEKVNGNPINMGTFYLDTWDGQSENEMTFNTVDAIGLIGKTNFVKGRMYKNENAEVIIKEIMDSAEWTKFEIEEGLKSIKLSGYIPICSHRNALQQVAFAMRAVVDCSRSDYIKIYRVETVADGKIDDDRLFMDGGVIKLKRYVSDVAITTHSYKLSAEQTEVFNGYLHSGFNRIQFSKPCSNLSVSSGTVQASGTNYADIVMNGSGSCVIAANVYIDDTSTYTARLKEIDAGESKSTVTINDATLVSKDNVYLIAEHILNYYALRKEATQEYILQAEKAGKWVNLLSQYGYIVSGGIEKQTIDLCNGFLATSQVVGYNTTVSAFYYTGNEVYTGERIGRI